MRYSELLNKIPNGFRLAIYGTNATAILLRDEINDVREDLNVKFFLNSFNEGNMEGIEIRKPDFLTQGKELIDGVIIASFSNSSVIEQILREKGIKNVYKIEASMLAPRLELNENIVSKFKKAKSIFSDKDKILYEKIFNVLISPEKITELYEYLDKGDVLSKKIYLDNINTEIITTAISGGAHNGDTTVNFVNNFTNLRNIYVFEPSYEKVKYEPYDQILRENNKVKIIEKGLWSEENELSFFSNDLNTMGSKISEESKENNISIQVTSIDKFKEENKIDQIDYIKMDIENAEGEALQGSLNVILRDRAQLAICIYHSPEQFLGIPIYLSEKLKDYEYRLGHYTRGITGTVLYGIPKEKIV